MSRFSRRSVLSALGLGLPFGLGARSEAGPGAPPLLRFRSFEESVRLAFADAARASSPGDGGPPCLRIAVGESDLVRAGIQGCHNARPFAGFPAGALRIVRAGSAPGPLCRGVRLYVHTVDVLRTDGTDREAPTRPLDFAALPPAPDVS